MRSIRRMFGFLMGIFAGWLIGSTIAILVAPQTGESLRGEIRTRSQGFVDDVKGAAEERQLQLQRQLAALRAPHND